MSNAAAHQQYSSVAAILHWTIAALIIGQIAGGWYMHQLPNSSTIKFDLYQLHKSFGLSILALALFRLCWRLTHRAPPLPAAIPGWQKLAARAVHWVFYVLMILTPLAGWAIVSVSPTDIPTKWFGMFTVPHLPFFGGETSRALEEMMEERHEFLAFSMLYLLGLHVVAALKHQLIDKDGVLRSILPEKKRHWMGAGAIVAVLAAGSLYYLATPNSQAMPDDRVTPGHDHDEQNDHRVESGSPIENNGDQHRQAVGAWVVDYDASSLRFVGSESGAEIGGAFSDYTVGIVFDPDDLDHASIDVAVATATAGTGSELRDSILPGSEWFNVKAHPTATFKSTAVRHAGERYEADGVLTIKNFKQPVTLNFTLAINGNDAVATGHGDLIRTDFGLGEAASWLDDEGVAQEVRVKFEIHAKRAN